MEAFAFGPVYRYEATFKSFKNSDHITEFSTLAQIYPNPATDRITIDLPQISAGASVSIYNVNGQQMIGTELSQDKSQLDISSLPAGFYVVKVLSNNGVISKIIIKE
jgi:hypothetical protein